MVTTVEVSAKQGLAKNKPHEARRKPGSMQLSQSGLDQTSTV